MLVNIEIDEVVAQQLESRAKARGISLRSIIQEVLSRSVGSSASAVGTTQFEQRTHDFGAHIESPWTILADIESEEYLKKHAKK